jgi:lipopolysaccharide transport system ATP-binding protein
VLFVSHNMGAINSLCDRGLYLRSGLVEYCGSVETALNQYLNSFQDGTLQTQGILYRKEKHEIKSDRFQITEIAALDQNKNIKSIIKTWDYLRIRIRYYCPQVISQGSVVLEIHTISGTKLMEYSTRPLSGFELFLDKGESAIDCIIPCLPLSAGSYRLNVGLAIPMTQWLCQEENIAVLEVASHDIYQSNFPPTQERTPIAVPYHWEVD